jgi:hypothetical protein
MDDLLTILTAMADSRAKAESPRDLFLDMCQRVVKYVAGVFGAKNDEVALLFLTSDGKHLRFAAPRKFFDLGTIPITKRDSIAVTIFGRKSGEAINNVPMVKHVSFFESVKLRDRAVPIQKMITVPILHDGKAIGVAQVSRKGENAAEAGPDFSPADVQKAQSILESVTPVLVQALPEQF